MHFKKFHYFNIEFISITHESFPNNNMALFIFFTLKFIGLIIFSNSFELAIDNNNTSTCSLCHAFRSITFFGSMTRENLTLINYDIIIIIIYIIILLPIVLYSILFCKCPSLSSNHTINSNGKCTHITFTPTYKVISKIAIILMMIIVVLSQHIVEYLLFPMILLIPNDTNDTSGLSSRLNNISSGLYVGPIPLLAINSLFVLIINTFIYFLFRYYNRPFLTKQFSHQFTFNDYFLYLLLLTFNFQGFHILLNHSSISLSIKYTFTILSLVLSVILVLCAMNSYIKRSLYNYIILSYIYFAIYSSIFSLIMHHTMQTQSMTNLTNEVIIDKFLIELIFVCITHYITKTIQDNTFNKVIKDNVLIKSKNIKGDYLFRLVEILKQCVNDTKQFALLFYLLENNQSKVTKSNLLGEDRLNLGSYFDKLKQENKFDLNTDHKQRLFKERYNNILVLIESEIVSHIFNLFCSKKILREIRIPLLHCDFISYFKLNYSFSLYLIQEYLSKIPKLSFESIVHFYSLKHFILSERENRLKQNHNNNSLHVKFASFIKHFEVLQEIKSHLIKNCTNYQQIISLKNVYSELKTKREARQFNEDLENLFKSCMKIDKSMRKLEETIIDNFSNCSLKNPELVYLITNFYEITQSQVPERIKENMIDIRCYDDVTKFDSAFLDQGFDHPMILTLSSANSFDYRNVKLRSNFIIYYVSQKLMNALGYKESELIGNDYHILLPRMFAEAHSIELKKVFFINENFQINNSQFILSKEGYYVKIKETSGMIPSLKNDTIVILNIAIDSIDKNSFLFITDIDSNIVTITQNFETSFQLNYEMIKRLGLTFSGLFNLNNDKILSSFNKALRSIRGINMEYIDCLMTIMNSNSYENILMAYKINKEGCGYGESYSQSDAQTTIRINKKKKKISSCLQKIHKQIEEQEYDTDWLVRIAAFEKICIERGESSFDIVITLKNVGHIPYFFIKVQDKDDGNGTIKRDSFDHIDKKEGIGTYSNSNGYGNTANANDHSKLYFHDVTQEQYIRKYNEAYRKSSFNQSFQRKDPKMKDSHNLSTTMNETSHQLLSNTKKPSSFISSSSHKLSFNPKSHSSSLIKKLYMNAEREMQMNNSMITQLKKRETFCSIVLFVLMIGMFLCFIANFFIKNSGITVIKESSELVFNVVKLKQSLLESALLLTSGFYQLDNLEPNPYDNVDFTPQMIKAQLNVRASEMYYFYNEYYEYLKEYSHIPEISSQLNTLQMNFTCYVINADFSPYDYNTTLETDMNYFHFHCGYMKAIESLTQCKIRDHFLGGVHNDDNATATIEEVFFYYFTHNIIQGFMNILDVLINESSVFLYSQTSIISVKFLYFNLAMLVVAFALFFAFVCLIVIYKQRIVSYLKVFIVKSEKTILTEKKLTIFKTILILFDNEICEVYEINKDKINAYQNGNGSGNGTGTRSDQGDKSPVGGDSSNNSPIPIYHNGNSNSNSKFKHKGMRISANDLSKAKNNYQKKEEYYQEEQFDANTMQVFSLKILIKAIQIFISSLLITTGVLIGNIIIDTNLFTKVLLSCETAFSYLDHTASLNELLLYYRVSILYKDANFITLPYTEYSTMMYDYKLASVNEININMDERYSLLNNSKMAFLYYRSSYERRVISYFESSNNFEILPILKQYNKQIDTEGVACQEFSSAYTKYVNDDSDSFDQSLLLHSCTNLEGGNSDKGINKQLEHFYTAVFDQYIDFVKNPEGDLATYSQASGFVSCLKLMTFIYNVSWHICVKIVNQELKNMFSKVYLVEIVFQIIELVINVLFCALYVSFVLGYLKLSIDRYGVIIERLKITLN